MFSWPHNSWKFVGVVMIGLSLTPLSWASQGNIVNDLGREYLELYMKFHPSVATSWGVHIYDGAFEDASKESLVKERELLGTFQVKLQSIQNRKMSIDESIDHQLLINEVATQILEIDDIRMWEKNPDKYVNEVTLGAFVLASRDFAPASERLRNLILRLNQFPVFLKSAQHNLRKPAKMFVDMALDQIPTAIDFFENEIPKMFPSDQNLQSHGEFRLANRKAISGLRDFQKFLMNLTTFDGEFRLGEEVLRKKILIEEMMDLPQEQLLKIGWADLRRNQSELLKISQKIDSKKSPHEILLHMKKNVMDPKDLLTSFESILSQLEVFFRTRNLLRIPNLGQLVVRESPPFKRALTLASMDPPGPFEKGLPQAFFNVTLPDKRWSKDETTNHLEVFHPSMKIALVTHEAIPGHYYQFQYVRELSSRIRKVFGARSNYEGWAHYCEQMVLDEGFDDPKSTFRFTQIHNALLRNARLIVSILIHTGKMSPKEAERFFITEAYQSQSSSTREVKRAIAEPSYLSYTLGKLAIIKLREDYLKMKKGTLFGFHNSFLKLGFPPIQLVRRALLGSKFEKELFNK